MSKNNPHISRVGLATKAIFHEQLLVTDLEIGELMEVCCQQSNKVRKLKISISKSFLHIGLYLLITLLAYIFPMNRAYIWLLPYIWEFTKANVIFINHWKWFHYGGIKFYPNRYIMTIVFISIKVSHYFNPLSTNPTKWSNILKQFVSNSQQIGVSFTVL